MARRAAALAQEQAALAAKAEEGTKMKLVAVEADLARWVAEGGARPC